MPCLFEFCQTKAVQNAKWNATIHYIRMRTFIWKILIAQEKNGEDHITTEQIAKNGNDFCEA